MGLSAAASIVLKYVRNHAVDGTAEIQDDAPFSEDALISACRELKRNGGKRSYNAERAEQLARQRKQRSDRNRTFLPATLPLHWGRS